MRKPLILLAALLLLTVGWSGAFLLGISNGTGRNLWIIPALAIGAGLGLSLRQVSGARTAMLLVVSAVLGLATVQTLSPTSHISLKNLHSFISGTSFRTRTLPLRVTPQLRTPPFDRPLNFTSPLDLDLSLYGRMPAGISDFCFAPDGALYVSLPELGAVYRLSAGKTSTPGDLFLHGLDHPSGLACRQDRILVATGTALLAAGYDKGQPRILAGGLPDDGDRLDHRLLAVDDQIYLSIEARCDACPEKQALRATLQSIDGDGKMREFARGLRQVGGLAFDPAGKRFWASERSRLFPAPGAADELNLIQSGADYGWPGCDAEEPDAPGCQGKVAPTRTLRRHANPADLVMSRELAYPGVYRDSMLLVLQGDAEVKMVPAVARLPLRDGIPQEPVAFLAGWDGRTTRPAAIEIGPDGALYIGDDLNGAIYRAAWQGSR